MVSGSSLPTRVSATQFVTDIFSKLFLQFSVFITFIPLSIMVHDVMFEEVNFIYVASELLFISKVINCLRLLISSPKLPLPSIDRKFKVMGSLSTPLRGFNFGQFSISSFKILTCSISKDVRFSRSTNEENPVSLFLPCTVNLFKI